MRRPRTDAPIEFTAEVADALEAGIGVVALETTIITHGMPWPQNVETALAVEDVIRQAGAVPATMAITKGRLRAGLTRGEIEALGQAKGVEKASRRDLAAIVAKGGDGATTVAGTMALADMAGIKVFVTGGLGGVHRGAALSMDVSADLTELARTPVAVVCAGVKSILDIGLTLEVLETHGVPVVGYGTDRFPAFYVPDSGHAAPLRVDGPQEAAALIRAQRSMGLGGVVIANPIPSEHAMAGQAIEAAIVEALAEADRRGIKGRDVTPFLLADIVARTEGRSLLANVALIKHNAAVGAAIANGLLSVRPERTILEFRSVTAEDRVFLDAFIYPKLGGGTKARNVKRLVQDWKRFCYHNSEVFYEDAASVANLMNVRDLIEEVLENAGEALRAEIREEVAPADARFEEATIGVEHPFMPGGERRRWWRFRVPRRPREYSITQAARAHWLRHPHEPGAHLSEEYVLDDYDRSLLELQLYPQFPPDFQSLKELVRAWAAYCERNKESFDEGFARHRTMLEIRDLIEQARVGGSAKLRQAIDAIVVQADETFESATKPAAHPFVPHAVCVSAWWYYRVPLKTREASIAEAIEAPWNKFDP